MTEHLPECPMSTKDAICCSLACICDALRACEQRVRKDEQSHFLTRYLLGRNGGGYRRGLDAAREAVENMRDALHTHYRIECEPPGKVDWSQHRKCDPVDDILAAIDALREEKK